MASKKAGKKQGAKGTAARIFFAALVLLAVLSGAFGNVRAAAAQEKTAVSNIDAAPEVVAYLNSDFCRGGLCDTGAWDSWIIVAQDSVWRVEELAQLREALLVTIQALDEAGFDGQALLAGYRFRRQNSVYVDGLIARVNHDTRVVTLADTAVQQLWGFYLYHELGHIVDRRLHLSLRNRFHVQAGSEPGTVGTPTADGYWMNEHGRASQGEAAADAFGLWVVMRYTDKPLPVFPHMPNGTDYAQIAAALETALTAIGDQRSGRSPS